VRTNQIPRQIPEQSFFTKPIPGIVMGGILPFGCIFIQLFFILNSIWYAGVRGGRWGGGWVWLVGCEGVRDCSNYFQWLECPAAVTRRVFNGAMFVCLCACGFQVTPDVLHVWLLVPGLHYSADHLLGGDGPALLLPPVCRGERLMFSPQARRLHCVIMVPVVRQTNNRKYNY